MAFYKKKTKAEAIETRAMLMPVNGEIDGITMALIKHAADREGKVRKSIRDSLLEIGRKHPNMVLSSIHDFLRSPKPGKDHRVILLTVSERIISIRRDEVSPELATQGLLKLLMRELLAKKDVIPDWQGASSECLISLGQRWPSEVLDILFAEFQPGAIPHYFVVKTLSQLVFSNPLPTVPKLKAILARTIPILASIKSDNLKWVFAHALGQYSEAILSYMANMDKAPDESINLLHFSSELFSAYEILFSNWMGGQSKVRLACVDAIGSMCAVLPLAQFESLVPQLIPRFVALYKKESSQDHMLPITSAMYHVLEVSTRDGSLILQPHLQLLLATLHPLICAPVPADSSNAMRNHNEMLRCVEAITTVFIDTVVGFLLQKLDDKMLRVKLGTLEIMKHLVTRLPEALSDRKGLFIAGLKPLVLRDESPAVKKAMAQVIISMAMHHYLDLEGSDTLLQFIVRNASYSDADIAAHVAAAKAAPKKSKRGPVDSSEEIGLDDLRGVCDNTLNLITTTIPGMENVMWPWLFEVLIPVEFTHAQGIVAKCLGHVAHLHREAQTDHFYLDFDQLVNLPKPPAIIARLLVLLTAPQRRGPLGKHILHCLRGIGPVLHPSVQPMWDAALPKLTAYLEKESASPDTWNQGTWEDLVLRLLSETIKVVNDPEWTKQLGDAYCEQLELYRGLPELKKSCLKHAGLVLQKMKHKSIVKSSLDTLFKVVDHNNADEQVGVAQAYGYASTTHMDIVLEKLGLLITGQMPGDEPVKKKKKGFFSNLFSSNKGPPPENMNTVFLCFGYVTAYAPPNLITSRVEVHVLTPMRAHYTKPSGKAAKLSLVQSLDLIGKAMHPSHLNQEAFILTSRNELVTTILDYIVPALPTVDSKGRVKKSKGSHPKPSDELRIAALKALSTMVLLKPLLPDELESQLVTRLVTDLMQLPVPGSDEDAAGAKERKIKSSKAGKAPPKSVEEQLASQRIVFKELNKLLGTVLFMNPSLKTLCRLLSSVQAYTSDERPSRRERSVFIVLWLLKKFVEFRSGEDAEGPAEEVSFNSMGKYIGLLMPRCCDPSAAVRRAAVEGVLTILFVDHLLRQKAEGATTVDMPDDLLSLVDVKERITTDVLNNQFQLVHEMSLVLVKAISVEELAPLILVSLSGLNDPELTSASGVCVYLNAITKARGDELGESIPELVAGLMEALANIASEKTMNGTLHVVKNLATHHLLPLLDNILETIDTPYPAHVVKSLQVIAKDGNLIVSVLEHLTHLMNNTRVYDEKKSRKISLPIPMKATCALSVILQTEDFTNVLMEHYALIFGSIVLRLGTTYDVFDADEKSRSALEQTFDLLRAFIACGGEDDLNEAMEEENAWAHLRNVDDFYLGVTTIAGAVACTHPDQVRYIYSFLLMYMQGNFEGQRIAVATVFAEFINQVDGSSIEGDGLLQLLLNCLLSSLVDPVVKIQCLRGMGNIVSAGEEKVNQYSQTVLDALLSSIDDNNEIIALESMNGLAKVFELVDEERVAPVLVNICHRIRPHFTKPNPKMRASAFNLFGTLWHFGQNQAAAVFYDQIHANLPALIMHLNDEDDSVCAAVKKTFRNFGPLFRASEINELVLSQHFDPDRRLRYEYFLEEFCGMLVSNYPERMNYLVMNAVQCFKSDWVLIRANAAAFCGFLLGALPEDDRRKSNLNPSLVANALINLLDVKEAVVREKAAQALQLLWSY